jgi:two-component system sensor kinase FixL
MDDTGVRGSGRSQTVFSAFMLGLAIGLVALISANAEAPRAGITLPTLLALGGLVACGGLVAAVFTQPWLLRAASAAMIAIGVTALLLLTVFPNPRLDAELFASGAWTSGPIPLRVGWAHIAMAGFLILSGAVLPLAQSMRQTVEMLVLTIVRLCLWASAFWQLGYVSLAGQFGHLFDRPASIAIQAGIFVALLIGWLLLLRGDRRWLATLTPRDRSVALARFILPVAALPVVGSYVVRSWAHLGGYSEEIAPLLNGEISSAGLLLLSSAALRSLWIERRTRGALAQALQRSPVIVQSLDGHIEYWPQECEFMFGYSKDEAVGKRTIDLLKTEFQQPIAEMEADLHADGEWSGEVRQTTRDGRALWIASRIVVVRPNEDEAAKIVETLTDITDLKQTMSVLGETTDSLMQAVGTYELGLVEFDAATARIKYSPEFEYIVGAETGRLGRDGFDWQSLLNPSDVDRLRACFIEDTASHASERSLSLQIRRLDGEIRDLNGKFRYRYQSNGSVQKLVGIFRDVTDQLRDREEVELRGARLLELQSELAHTSRLSAMGEMAAALAHELNQPLTAVANSVGAVEMILKDPDRPVDDKRRAQILRAAKHAETQAVRAGEIIRRLREFISRGEADTSVESLGRLIDESLALALPNAGAEGITVERTVAAKASRVLANRIQIQQVLVNMIRNAVESMRGQFRPKSITIAATAEDGMATISITDTGAGVSADLVERLFSPFMSTKADGMGVGLSICRRIVEAHGGKLWYEETEGLGARFKFTLPLFMKD